RRDAGMMASFPQMQSPKTAPPRSLTNAAIRRPFKVIDICTSTLSATVIWSFPARETTEGHAGVIVASLTPFECFLGRDSQWPICLWSPIPNVQSCVGVLYQLKICGRHG